LSQVAVVEVEGEAEGAVRHAVELVGGCDNAQMRTTPVIVKVGIYKHTGSYTNYPTVDVVRGITSAFNDASTIYLVESDNYKGSGTERLHVYRELFTPPIAPFNLSEDADTRQVEIAGESMSLSHLLVHPNIFVSTHALRRSTRGTILKNLFGLLPLRKKAAYHKKLVPVLLDLFEAIGGINLAVLDATRTYSGTAGRRSRATNVIIAGTDAVAVETVGATLVGPAPTEMPILQEAISRGLGEGDLDHIEILGTPIDDLKPRFRNI
jgi:uncharacterized protein (DUF362 family)